MTTSNLSTTPEAPAPRVLRCGGCFKPVDPETSLKRPIYVAMQGRSRYRRVFAEPVVEHFCNAECRQRSDTAAASNGRFL